LHHLDPRLGTFPQWTHPSDAMGFQEQRRTGAGSLVWSTAPSRQYAYTAILPFWQYYDNIEDVNADRHTGMGLRQRKWRETRSALSRAAIRLCIQRGWETVTVDDIAAAANVSPRTFRNYFSTKAEAVAAGHLERMLRIADELRARPADEPLWTAIVNSVASQFEPPARMGGEATDAGRWMKRIRFILTEPAIHGEVLRATEAAQIELAKAIGQRLGAKRVNDTYPQLAAAMTSAIVGVVMERWLRDGPSCSIASLMREAFDLVAIGFPQNAARAGKMP
jgi:AcrR family transcriptional regulator